LTQTQLAASRDQEQRSLDRPLTVACGHAGELPRRSTDELRLGPGKAARRRTKIAKESGVGPAWWFSLNHYYRRWARGID